MPEEQVERLKTEFEQKKQERIRAEFAKKDQFKADKQQKLKDITEEGNSEVARKKKLRKSAKTSNRRLSRQRKIFLLWHLRLHRKIRN